MELILDEVIEQVKQWVEKRSSNTVMLLRDFSCITLPVELRDVMLLQDKVIVTFYYQCNDDDIAFVVMQQYKYINPATWIVNKYEM